MKKLIGALALAAMVATSAFAEVSFGAWLCTLPTLIGSDGDGIKGAGVSNPWGWGARPARLDINWTSDDGKAGMTMGVYSDFGGGLGGADAMDMWIKPVDQVKITIGKMDNFNGLRGDLCFGSWNWLRPNTARDGLWGEGLTFSKTSDQGVGIQIFPVEALQIFASLPLAASVGDKYPTVLTRMDKAFGKGSIGAAYTIDGIGKLKVQMKGQYDKKDAVAATTAGYYIGDTNYGATFATAETAALAAEKNPSDLKWQKAGTGSAASTKYGTFEAAFDLTAVDKLFATIGFGFTLADGDYWKTAAFYDTTNNVFNNMMKISLGASYGITEAFKLSADFSMLMFNGDQKNIKADSAKPAMVFGVGLDYALTDALGLTADVRMLLPNNEINPLMSFLVGAQYAVGSNASLGIGFQATVEMGSDDGTKIRNPGNLKVVEAGKDDDGKLKKFIFAVPIRASIWF